MKLFLTDTALNSGFRGELSVERFFLIVAYRDTSAWSTRIELMVEWRRLAREYSDMDVSVWETNSHFVDQMLSLKSVTLTSVVVTLISMDIICLLFIPSLMSLVGATFAIGLICLGNEMGCSLISFIMNDSLVYV